MIDLNPMPGSPARATPWWCRWPAWSPYAAGAVAACYGIVLAVVTLSGNRLYGIPGLGWAAAALLLIGAALASATVRRPPSATRARLILTGLWTVALVAVLGSAFVLLNLVELAADGSIKGRDGRSDWASFAERIGFAAVALLLVMAALAWRHRIAGTCPRCGGAAHQNGTVAGIRWPASAASPRIRRSALLGGLAFIPYYSCHLMRFFEIPPFASGRLADGGDWFIPAFVICTAVPAEFLLQGLVHQWGVVFPRWTLWLSGRHVPRFLPIVPVWLIAPTLAAYGIGGWAYELLAITGVVRTNFGFPDYLLAGCAMTAFAGYGWALAAAGWSYQRRTRPICVIHPAGRTPQNTSTPRSPLADSNH